MTATYNDRMAPFTCDDIFSVNIDVFFEGGLSFLDMLLKNFKFFDNLFLFFCGIVPSSTWRCDVVVITTVQLHSIKPELRFCTELSNPACSVSEICDGEDL